MMKLHPTHIESAWQKYRKDAMLVEMFGDGSDDDDADGVGHFRELFFAGAMAAVAVHAVATTYAMNGHQSLALKTLCNLSNELLEDANNPDSEL